MTYGDGATIVTDTGDDPQKKRFLKTIGADTRQVRDRADVSCEAAARVLNSYGNRDRISKFERGVSGMDMFEYLKLMWWMRDFAPGHPAVALAKAMLPPDVLATTGMPRRMPIADLLTDTS